MLNIARSLLALCPVFLLVLAVPAQARQPVVERWVEKWDEASQQWVRVDVSVDEVRQVQRFVTNRAHVPDTFIASYGPFRVLSESRVALVAVTDADSPAQFAAMLRDYPHISVLEMIECPGTEDDRGNLDVGRMIRKAGLETYVPAGGSVRSGAVELFLAGKTRRIEEGAAFAVHSWIDNFGRQASDYATDARINLRYLSYYREMGMSDHLAHAFYEMTNSVPNAQVKWLSAQDMRRWTASMRDPTQGKSGQGKLVNTKEKQPAMDTPRLSYASGHLDSPVALAY